MPGCLILVENLPVPADRRVWQEACALRDAGWDVTVVCPATEKFPEKEAIIDGIHVLRHAMPIEARGAAGYLLEYCIALWHEMRLSWKVFRARGFDVMQICNPPDLMFLVALPYKLLGRRVIFDHHDICPELYESKFGREGLVHVILHGLLRVFEWMTFKCADVVISANRTFADLAVRRGGKDDATVYTVYSIPDLRRFHRVDRVVGNVDEAAPLVIGYVGIMGQQDGVDILLRAAALLKLKGHQDFRCRIVGDGPELPHLKILASRLGLEEHCEFTGFLSGDALLAALSSFDIGVIPDPYDVYNDKISMNKVFEYAALGIPITCFRLNETARLLGDSACYASNHTTSGLAFAIETLIVNEELRRHYAQRVTEHARQRFRWADQSKSLLAAYRHALRLRLGIKPAHAAMREKSIEAVSEQRVEKWGEPR